MTALRPLLARGARHTLCRTAAAARTLGIRPPPATPVAYVCERAAWTLRWVGEAYAGAIERRVPGTIEVTDRPYDLDRQVAHFGSQFLWQLWDPALSRHNRIVISFYHGKPDDGPDMARNIDYILRHRDRLARVHTAASPVERRLLDWGLAREKVVRVPLGVDTAAFTVPSPAARAAARARAGVPDGRLCIGSFQKDGIGWGDGREPKLIKGPDLFVEAVRRLARDFPVFVLLSGPARGYVKDRLERLAIPYRHLFLDDYGAIPALYQALDLYLVTSREEGGPQALLESMAAGVPLVSSRTGMAEDLIEPGRTGFLAEVEDVDAMTAAAARILGEPDTAAALRRAGRETACAQDWDTVGERMYREVYAPLLA